VNVQQTLGGGGTLNGIAYNPESDTFFITGKLWPKIFEVRFVAQEG
jgi:glutamine cyclotransferase